MNLKRRSVGPGFALSYTNRMKVYIVDDTSFIRIICRYHLVKAGYQVVGEAHEGETAEVEIMAMQPDCVLMDLALPGKNGAEIMRVVQKVYPHIQFVVLSALDRDMLTSQYPDVYFSSYIRKPFEAQELLEAISTASLNMEKKKHG
jgi:two-component system, chemotaxis family, chemotaxis protein CheY